MTEIVTTCLLNLRVTWQLSWERIATWGRPWRRCVQRGDVLITPLFLEYFCAGVKKPLQFWGSKELIIERNWSNKRELHMV